jgi:exodeoxyribonuclease VII large subunit
VLDWSPEGEEEAPLGVGELVSYLAETLAENFSAVLVLGELTNWSQPRSGHRYFTLSDGEAAIDCVMWRGHASRLAFRPEAGDEVVCRGAVGVYERQGRMQLYVTAMKPVGAGAAQKALEALKRKLTEEGLFEAARKRPLPHLPRAIGVVTSRSGAALHDILRTLALRFPSVPVLLSPATVQGAEAPDSIVGALGRLAAYGGIDVAIVGRGGGAVEDLAAFNDERVVRTIAGFPVPVVSAVGHEVDVTLADLAADHRAATPTAAAEAVVPVRRELFDDVRELGGRLGAATERLLARRRAAVAALGRALRDPAYQVVRRRQGLDQTALRLERALAARHRRAAEDLELLQESLRISLKAPLALAEDRLLGLERRAERAVRRRAGAARRRAAEAESKLAALSPLAVLDRGYALVRAEATGRLVRDAGELAVGDALELRFRRGRARARVAAGEDES